MSKEKGFTLAEVLVVIGVIGLVAALTILTLVPLIKDKVNKKRKQVIETRLIQGFNQLNTIDDGFNASQYTDTEGFVRALSKHYKMSHICGANNLKNCFTYSSFKYTKQNGKEDTKIWEDINTPADFGLMDAEYLAPAGFINAQGISFVLLLKKDCIMDSGESIKNFPTSCVQYLYDNNGSNMPNKIDSDIVHSLELSIGATPPDGRLQYPIGEYKTYYFLNPKPTSINTCDGSEDIIWDDRGSTVPGCAKNGWAAAKKACKEKGFELPTMEQLREINCRISGATQYRAFNANTIKNCTAPVKDTALAAKYLEKHTNSHLWSSDLSASGAAYFTTMPTDMRYAGAWNYCGVNHDGCNIGGMCLGK